MSNDSILKSMSRREVLQSSAIAGGSLLGSTLTTNTVAATDGDDQAESFDGYMSVSSYHDFTGDNPVECIDDDSGWGETFYIRREAENYAGEAGVFIEVPASCSGDGSKQRYRGYLNTAHEETVCQGGPSGDGPWVQDCCSWVFVDEERDVPVGLQYRITEVHGPEPPEACHEDAQPTNSDGEALGAPFDVVRVSFEPVSREKQWEQIVKLAAEDGDDDDRFGISVAIDGDTAVIGAYGDEDPNGEDAGSAYVFTRSEGNWSQQQKLIPDDGNPDDRFGNSVAIDGDTIVVGAVNDEHTNGRGEGSAYVFTRSGGEWSQQQRLIPDNADDGLDFGTSAAIDGDTIIIGDNSDTDEGLGRGGFAYVFTRSEGSWSQQTILFPDMGDVEDIFGGSVTIDGDTAVIGATGDSDNERYAGAAYVFTRSEGEWSRQAKLAADDGDDADRFGTGVALDDDTVVIGAYHDEDPNGVEMGSAYVFTRNEDSWTQQAKLAADAAADDATNSLEFGVSAAVEGDTIVVGTVGAGAIVFTRSDSGWNQQQKLTLDDGDTSYPFGRSVAIDGDTIFTGHDGDAEPNGDGAGSVYVYSK